MIEVIIHKANGTIINMDDFKNAFNEMQDGKILITMKDYRKRSLRQNAYYWTVVVPMVKRGLYDIGFDEVQTDEDAHELLKKQFIRRQFVNKQTGEVVTITGSSVKLTIPEFNEYIENICRWSLEYLNVHIPSPNEELVEFENWESEMICDEAK